jgi:thioredoxin-dependent peroxiredoxin
MKLKVGQAAPHFRLKDVFGRTIDLDEYKNRKILLAFFRHAGCPFCNLHVHALTKIYEDVKSRGTEMIFFFESKEAIILRSSFHKGVSPIPLISDPEKLWYHNYGLQPSALKSAISHVTSFIPTLVKAQKAGVPVHMPDGGESLSTMPAEFLVDKNNIIRKALYAESLNHRLELQEVIDFSKGN